MNVTSTLAAYWYYHVPNFILAALMYTLLGRVLLGLLVQPESSNYIWRFFCLVTDPVVAVFAKVTPKAAVPVIVWLFAFVWLFWIRVILHLTLLSAGLAPRVGGAS
jgi:YggT family protein